MKNKYEELVVAAENYLESVEEAYGECDCVVDDDEDALPCYLCQARIALEQAMK